MQNNVKRVTSGLIWTYAERITAQLINILVTVVLARIIAPDDYGIISIVNIFINIANAFVVSGFGNALIQKKNAEEIDYSTVFYFGIGFSMVIYLVLFISAPYIGAFYGMLQLPLVIRVLAVRLPIAAINSVQQAFISKRMEFKKFFFATLGGTIVSAVVGVTMALNGFGIWSLVAQYLTNVSIDTIVLSFTSGWKPRLQYSHERMKGLFSFGWKIMAVSVFTTLYSSLRNLIIGKKYTSADLAFSEKGEQFPSAIAGNINTSITKVLFPVLSEKQDDTNALKSMVRRSIKIGAYVLFPLMYGFASIADSFVRLFLTEKWIGCVPYLIIMCAIYSLQPLQTSSLQAVKAIGKSGLYLRIDIIKKIVGILILAISLIAFNNVFYVILGALVTEIFSVLVLFPINKKNLQYGYVEQIKDIIPAMILTGTMCIAIYGINFFLPLDPAPKIMVDILVGTVTYICISLITKNDDFKYILNILKGWKKK